MQQGVNRFIEAQNRYYNAILKELQNGLKVSHWVWFIFPQLKGIGNSPTANYYGIDGINEARSYMKNRLLRKRYIQCCKLLLKHNKPIEDILGYLDSLKLRSSLTLFWFSDERNRALCEKLLKKFFDGAFCQITLRLLEQRKEFNKSPRI